MISKATYRKIYFVYFKNQRRTQGGRGFFLASSLSLMSVIALSFSAPAQAATYVMGAIGDSISSGFNSHSPGDNRGHSWSTATSPKIKSHYRRLQEFFGEDVNVIAHNEAIAGSISANLPRQVKRLIRHRPHYVTISIGANDICKWDRNYTDHLNTYKANVRNIVATLIESREDIDIKLMPIPDLYHLWETGSQHGCQRIWDIFKICPSLLSSNATPESREGLRERRNMANQYLEEIAAEFPSNVNFSQEVANAAFEWHHMSRLDCFHPSAAGQDLIADLTWIAPTNTP